MRRLNALSLLILLASALALFWGAYSYFKSQELEKAAARLTFYQTNVAAELENFAHLPYLLSFDHVVIDALTGGDTDRLNTRLKRFAQSAGIDAIYVMEATGLTIASSNAGEPRSFVGYNYAFRPYFKQAMAGKLGEFYGIGTRSGLPGYFYSMAVRGPGQDILGVVVIKLDLSEVQQNWARSGERIILANADGVTLLASNPTWRYRSLSPLDPDQRARILATRQFGSQPLEALNWSPNSARQTAEIDGETLLYLRSTDLSNGWSLHFFVPDDPAVTNAWLVTGTMLVLSALAFIVWQRRQVRAIGDALTRSETNEAQLRQANARLAIEIEERREAEARLQKTKIELERAGRLAALGQLASSVTHELGQPIAAMRNYLVADEIASGKTQLGEKMQGLVDRMENITRQLKFFSRKGRDKFEPVDLRQVVTTALELLAPNIETVGAEVRFSAPDAPVQFVGNVLRLEQVVTNLVRNALDAVEDAPLRKIEISLQQSPAEVWIEVADSGPGLGDASLDDLREPFATTRESGKGMGLGLTISAGIVADHNGTLSAATSHMGGALFRASFPPVAASEAA